MPETKARFFVVIIALLVDQLLEYIVRRSRTNQSTPDREPRKKKNSKKIKNEQRRRL